MPGREEEVEGLLKKAIAGLSTCVCVASVNSVCPRLYPVCISMRMSVLACGTGVPTRVSLRGTDAVMLVPADEGDVDALSDYGRYLHDVKGELYDAERYYRKALAICPHHRATLKRYSRLLDKDLGTTSRLHAYAPDRPCLVLIVRMPLPGDFTAAMAMCQVKYYLPKCALRHARY